VVLEAGATAARGNKPQEAETLLTEGLQMFAKDTRVKMPGEEGLWHYKRAVARVMLKRTADAKADLTIALRPDSVAWVRGRSHLEMARLASQQGDREGVKRAAASAIAACEEGNDPMCVEEARKIR
jgi:hypothetical protein